MQVLQPHIDQVVKKLETARDELAASGAVVSKKREESIITQREHIQSAIDNVIEIESSGLVGRTLDKWWKELYRTLYELEGERNAKHAELDGERREKRIHDDEVTNWKGYYYQLPGEYDRLQAHAGEIRSMGELVLIQRGEDGVDETNLMLCGYNEFFELMTADLTKELRYEIRRRAASMQCAYKKFKGDLEHIASTPEDAPKQRIVVMQISLIDVIDPVDEDVDNPLVKRDAD